MLLFEIDRNIEAVVCTLPVAILVHKAAGNVVGLDPLETVYLRERPLEVAGRDTPDLLLTVEHADGGLPSYSYFLREKWNGSGSSFLISRSIV